VPKAEVARSASLNEQVTAVARAVVRAAQGEQVVQTVAPSGFTRAEMMHVDEGRVAVARYLAAMPIAQQHRATDGRRTRLRGALRMGRWRSTGHGRPTWVRRRHRHRLRLTNAAVGREHPKRSRTCLAGQTPRKAS
jgi:hypothetical protein